MDKLDLAAIRERAGYCDRAGDNADIEAMLDAVDALLALPTPMPTHGSEQYAMGWDAGFAAFRREARRIFGVGDE